jgi:putative membrane protein
LLFQLRIHQEAFMRKLAISLTAVALVAAASYPVIALGAPAESRVSVDTFAPSSTRVALDDATIVAIFDAANTADVETGELAAQRGQSKEVREMGAMFARDHRMVRQQGRDLAKKLGVTPTPPANDQSAKQQAETMSMLRSKSGADFDKAYLDHEVAFHKAVIDAINQQLLPAIKNAELKALVEKVAPAFQAHMMAAQSLDKKLFGEQASSK